MQKTRTKEGYIAFGFHLLSDIEFPELLKAANTQEWAKVEIEVDANLKYEAALSDYEYLTEEACVTMRMKDAGVFRIQNGNKIIVAPADIADEALIRLYVLGSCMGILLMQRSIYPLHGSAVVIKDKAYAIIGDSGAGKSTLASAFVGSGYLLLTDDIVPIAFSGTNGNPMVTPSYPQQKLWKQSLEAFGMNETNLPSIFGRKTKYCVPVEDKYCKEPVPLAGIFELTKTEASEASISPVKKLERLPLLFQHTYRQFLIPRMDLTAWHFGISAMLGERLPFYRLQRSTTAFSAPQLVDLILDTIAKEEHK